MTNYLTILVHPSKLPTKPDQSAVETYSHEDLVVSSKADALRKLLRLISTRGLSGPAWVVSATDGARRLFIPEITRLVDSRLVERDRGITTEPYRPHAYAQCRNSLGPKTDFPAYPGGPRAAEKPYGTRAGC
jgi:hypothetical protein